ncbi:MAG: type I methionyl aminopeptidase [Lentisphaerae bacterium RIFOXYB12_FULL_65_16]|nr:MAG: type I methionyl aminopeptidase [Lentisphaerae bacterium RIFOXYA12_64_32]OGV93307.1 MAG: type I methionyl aminopeptidase [Lentisphaerae bacterium RIFOXYB12_FULL_65_16]
MPGPKFVIHTEAEIEGIRRAAQAAARVLDGVCQSVRPGLSTLDLDRTARRLIEDAGGKSAFHGYRGFPGQLCISLNDEVVHGIGRADRILKPGDLVSLDVGVCLDGCIGDTARTVCVVAAPSPEAERLLRITQESLEAGIAAARGGNGVNDIGRAVEATVRRAGFSVVRDFVGHGCGLELHEPPEVPNFSQMTRGALLRPGMVLAVEPMVNVGTHRVTVDPDGWTVRTADGRLSAHFEHMILITRNRPEILTWLRTA